MSSSDQSGADEVGIIFNEQKIKVSGREVTVREFDFFTGLQVSSLAQPLIDDLADALRESNEGDIGMSVLERVFAEHFNILKTLIIKASDIENIKDLDNLNDADGQLLLKVFWTVNSHFFISRLQTRSLEKSNIERALR